MTRFSLVCLTLLVAGNGVAAESVQIPAQVAVIDEPYHTRFEDCPAHRSTIVAHAIIAS